jgi:hypothetical protein|tara:strand:+ start:50 stop:316 length:267 start_codon:yes stop_codon:yes gene_type:complete
MTIGESHRPSVGDLCEVVDPRKAFPHVEHGEILYSNLEGDVRVGDILLVVGESEGKFGTSFLVTKDGIKTEVHSFFTRKYVGDKQCSK